MATLMIRVETPIDPTLSDPHDVAENIIETYNEDRIHSMTDWPDITFVSAEWED